MQCFQGKSVYKGIAMGPIVVLKKNDYQVKRTRIEDTEAEVKRVDEALEKHPRSSFRNCMTRQSKKLARPVQQSLKYIR